MEKRDFAKIFGLGDRVTTTMITKCLAAGMLMGKAEERTRLAKLNNPGLTRDLRHRLIFQNVGKKYPGLEEELTADQAETLVDLINKNEKLFSAWK